MVNQIIMKNLRKNLNITKTSSTANDSRKQNMNNEYRIILQIIYLGKYTVHEI